jgi:hypothetical protein
MEHNI